MNLSVVDYCPQARAQKETMVDLDETKAKDVRTFRWSHGATGLASDAVWATLRVDSIPGLGKLTVIQLHHIIPVSIEL